MRELYALKGVKVFLVNELRREINPLFDLISLLKIYRVIRKGNYDVIHTHSSKAGVLGRVAAFLAGKKTVVHTIHGLPFHPYQRPGLNALYILLEKFCALFTARIITVCDAMKDKAVSAGIAPENRFTTVYSGMDLDRFLSIKQKSPALMEKLGLGPGDAVVGKIARLFPLKGHEYFISAAREIADENVNVKFLLVGDGILMDDIREASRKAGLGDRFIFAGLVPRDEIPSYISVMDVVVHTSLREGLARVLPQALASGKPAVSFDIDGAGEVVRDGETGFLAPPGDAKSTAAAAVSLLADPGRATRMGEAGRELVKKMFAEEQMVSDINAVYRNAAHR